jgi:integrase
LQKALTHAVVEGLKPPADRLQLDVWDQRKPGFGIRVTKNGTKTWLLMYRQGGRKVRYTLGRFPALSLADARKEAARVLGGIAQGIDLARERAERKAEPTFGDLAADYLRFHGPKKKPRSVREDERMLRVELLPRWAERKLSDIRRRDVIAMLDEIAERAPIRANRVRALCSKMFNFAIQRGGLEFNPAHNTPRSLERPRDRRLSDPELRQLWLALEAEPPHVAALFKLALYTAARRSELTNMAWSEIDLEQGWWTPPSSRSKNNRERRIPLSGSALALLRQLRDGSTEQYVFPGRRSGTPLAHRQDWIDRIRQRAGLAEAWSLHDLRRSAASGLAALGVARPVIARVLGHAESGVTGIHYDKHGYSSEQRRALQKWDHHLRRVTSGQVEANVIKLPA